MNTAKAYNKAAEQGYINSLKSRGIDPTEENITKLKKEIDDFIKTEDKKREQKRKSQEQFIKNRGLDQIRCPIKKRAAKGFIFKARLS